MYDNYAHNIVSFAGRGIIETPLENVAAFVKNLDSAFIWKKFITVSYTQHYNQGTRYIYAGMHRILDVKE